MTAGEMRAAKGRAGGAERAAREVLAGEPGPAARKWLGPLSLVAVALFAVNTYLVLTGLTSQFDLGVAAALQEFPWGPVSYWMTLTNVTGGPIQDLAGMLVVLALFVYDRPACYLMSLGATGCLFDHLMIVSLARRRPTAVLF